MNRLTSKTDSSINYKVKKNGQEWTVALQNGINKLGELEDLMENYGIESVEELELIIKDHKRLYNKEIELSADLGMYQNENERLTKDIEKYWELEQQLGINLEDLFKEFIDIKNNLGEVDSDITPDYLAYVVSDGITYRKLSKELGCDLGVVIKALLDGGIIDHYKLGCQLNGVVLDGSGDIYLSAVNGDLSNVKDYQKTWWLASDKKEISNDN